MIAALLWLAVSGPAGAASAPPPTASTATARVLSTEDRRRALLLVDLLIEEQRHARAEAIILERLAADPEWWDWQLRLARLRNIQRRYDESADAYRRLLAERGDDPGLLIQYGHQTAAAGDLPSARRAFEKARGLTDDPVVPYELSEIAHAQGREADSRRWGEEALKSLEGLEGPGPGRMRLRLLARLRWDDALEDEYGRLYDKHQDPETLVDWVGALIRRGLADAAAEPSALLRERHPAPASRWRLLEHERLRRAGDDRGAEALLDESVATPPVEPALLLAAGELEMERRRWTRAEPHLERALGAAEIEAAADALLVETRRRSHHHAGPLFRWRGSDNSTLTETGVLYTGYPRRTLRLEAEASSARYVMRSRGETFSTSGAAASLAREAGPWTVGADLDLANTRGGSAASPGLFGRWERRRASVKASFFTGRAWRASPEAAAVDARADELEVAGRVKLWPRVSAGASAKLSRYAILGAHARQSLVSPELSLTLTDSPFFSALSYKIVALDAAGDDAFFARLPLLRHARTHYAVLSAGRHWLHGRLRADGYIYNGHEPARGRRFGTDALVGWGGNVEWIFRRVVLMAGYDDTREIFEGVGGRSRSVNAALLWRWRGNR